MVQPNEEAEPQAIEDMIFYKPVDDFDKMIVNRYRPSCRHGTKGPWLLFWTLSSKLLTNLLPVSEFEQIPSDGELVLLFHPGSWEKCGVAEDSSNPSIFKSSANQQPDISDWIPSQLLKRRTGIYDMYKLRFKTQIPGEMLIRVYDDLDALLSSMIQMYKTLQRYSHLGSKLMCNRTMEWLIAVYERASN